MARRELDRQLYHRDEPGFLDRLLRRISDWFDSLSQQVPGNQPGDGRGSNVALIVLIVVLILVIALIWWRIGSVRRNPAGREALLEDRPTRAKDHRAEADRYAAAGQWPEAIRERLRAIARDLEERVILDPRPGRTADELAAEAGAALPDHADELAVGVRIFDDVWYGGRAGDADGYRRMTELDDRLRSAKPVPLATRTEADAMARPR